MSDSGSDEEFKVKPKKKRGRLGRPPGIPNVKQKGFKCKFCGEKFASKYIAYKHKKNCDKNGVNIKTLNKCVWCGLEFANRGNLATHAFHMHGDSSYRSIDQERAVHTCIVCNKTYFEYWRLKAHIRRTHFNFTATVPTADHKEINQVWFERVLNSTEVLEIRKTAANCLVMRRLPAPPPGPLAEVDTIDLTHRYLTQTPMKEARANCPHCRKSYLRRDIKKHIDEVHLNRKKHHCNNCGRLFKRAYQFLHHHCGTNIKRRQLNGVKHHKDSTLRIVSVESLGMPIG